MKNCIVLLFAGLFLSLQSKAQGNLKPIDIGNVVPDVEIKNIVNYTSATAKLSDFKGKLLILDFWATWCQPCVAAFPKLDSLQKEFGDKIRILPVSSEKQETVTGFLDRYSKIKKLAPPSVTDDRVLHKLFRHTILPHCVWINEKGKVIAITEGKDVSRKNIGEVLAGRELYVAVKKDVVPNVVVNSKGTVFMPGIHIKEGEKIRHESLPDSTVVIHNVLTRYVEGLSSGTQGDALSVQAFNLPIVWLYRVALWKNGPNIMHASKTIVDIDDPVLYDKITSESKDGTFHLSGLQYLSWLKENGYSYEIKVPAPLRDSKCEIMLTDLNKYFGALYGIEGVIEQRKAKYLALVRTTGDDKLASKGGKPEFDINKLYMKLQNCMLNVLVMQLATPLQLHPAIIDETGYTGRVDMQLNCELSDLDALNRELARYGLALKEKEKVQEIAVIRKIKDGRAK